MPTEVMHFPNAPLRGGIFLLLLICLPALQAEETEIAADVLSSNTTVDRAGLIAARAEGIQNSKLRRHVRVDLPNASGNSTVPKPRLKQFREQIEPILRDACVRCHGDETQEASLRLDQLDPDLMHGEDVDWWIEVVDVISNGEMPPAEEITMPDEDRRVVIEWLSSEMQLASFVRRDEQAHSSFRRLTRYEYNYALQDLLGLPYDFAEDLPPEPNSVDGFSNSSEVLQMTAMQFEYYREIAHRALSKAIVRGEAPKPVYYSISMKSAAAKIKSKYSAEVKAKRNELADDPEELARQLERIAARHAVNPNIAHYRNRETGETKRITWRYSGAKYAWEPLSDSIAGPPAIPEVSSEVAILPARQKMIVELGDSLPDRGDLRVRIRASRTKTESPRDPTLRLEFGWQASNNSSATDKIDGSSFVVDALPDSPQFYQVDIPLSEVTRNPMRGKMKMGKTPNPSEFISIVNESVSKSDVQIDYIELVAAAYDQWPPSSHRHIFIDSGNQADETAYARDILKSFMGRAWRRPATDSEIDQKLQLYTLVRPQCGDFQEAITEVLATVLASPKFLYLARVDESPATVDANAPTPLSDYQLATRLSMFLWSSSPDGPLLDLAAKGQLGKTDTLLQQVDRMLFDERSKRFPEHFVRGWLGMELLDYLKVDKKAYRNFDVVLKEAMQREPIAFFEHVLHQNRSVLDFVHADYALVNERLAKHYELENVYGNHFRKVLLTPEDRRGGLLTQAGLLAMNSDGKDSHPLKRGIWLLESLLNDPPPPPPPAVPEIDLADPEIAKLTLKQRIENHRDDPACMSCHSKIDPWGIAFENYDAIGRWREQVNGVPVDASSVLFNKQPLDGVDSLKRFLFQNRQDQFARAITHKLATYALGRPLTFADRASVDRIASDLRKEDDGLKTLVRLIVTSELFRTL